MNNALLSSCLHLVQARYILGVVITQMQRSKGHEVNFTTICLTPGLDCLRGFPHINIIKVSELIISSRLRYRSKSLGFFGQIQPLEFLRSRPTMINPLILSHGCVYPSAVGFDSETCLRNPVTVR